MTHQSIFQIVRHLNVGRTTVNRLAAIGVLAIVCLTVGNANADLLTVTAVTDHAQAKHDPIGLDLTETSNILGGTFIDLNDSGYRSTLGSGYGPNSLMNSWNPSYDVNTGALPEPDTLLLATSEVMFTANGKLSYTAAGNNDRGSGLADSLAQYSLVDNTVNQTLVTFSDGWASGVEVGNTTGSLTGILLDGHQYTWTASYRMSNAPGQTNTGATGSGNASLNVTSIPEPTGLGLIACLAGFTFLRRR